MEVINSCHVNLITTPIFTIHLCEDGDKSGYVEKCWNDRQLKEESPRKSS